VQTTRSTWRPTVRYGALTPHPALHPAPSRTTPRWTAGPSTSATWAGSSALSSLIAREFADQHQRTRVRSANSTTRGWAPRWVRWPTRAPSAQWEPGGAADVW